jgi:lambda family phage portal protein
VKFPRLFENFDAFRKPDGLKSRATRAYAGARASRLTTGFGSAGNSSADTELSLGLTQLRSRSRQLMRDAPYAKRARTLVVNNVIGTGVGLQAQVKSTRDTLHTRVNDDIESAFTRWACADSCHTGGTLHFGDFERAVLSEVFTAGEAFVRMHYSRFGESRIPLALELIEAERVADEFASPAGAVGDVRMGVEVDKFGRPLAYWIRDRHPGELRYSAEQTTRLTRVPAEDVIHLRIVDRWPQTRGEPWLHAAIRKLHDMDEYTGAELTAARMSANYFATIESADENPMPGTDVADDGSRQLNIEPGVIDQLRPGEKLEFHTPNRPNDALDPFLRYMLREVACAANVSYAPVSGDYSQSNYSSSRLSLLDDRDQFKALQQWYVRNFRARVHAVWLQQAVLSRQIPALPVESYVADPERYMAARWKLRGWSWIDPSKEVEAARDAIAGGLTTHTDVIEQTGGGQDIEDFIEKKSRELKLFKDAGLDPYIDTLLPKQTAGAPPKPEPKEDDAPRRALSLARGLPNA